MLKSTAAISVAARFVGDRTMASTLLAGADAVIETITLVLLYAFTFSALTLLVGARRRIRDINNIK